MHLFSSTAACVLGVMRWECCHSHHSQLKSQQFQQRLCWKHLCIPVFSDTLSSTSSNSSMWFCVLCWSPTPLNTSHLNTVFALGKWLSLSLDSCFKVREPVFPRHFQCGSSAFFQCSFRDLGVQNKTKPLFLQPNLDGQIANRSSPADCQCCFLIFQDSACL